MAGLRSGDLGESRRRAPGLARARRGLPATGGRPWAEDPGPAPLGRAGSADRGSGLGCRGGGLGPWAAVKPGREPLEVCWKMIDCGWCLLATVYLLLKPPAGLLDPALGDFSAPGRLTAAEF